MNFLKYLRAHNVIEHIVQLGREIAAETTIEDPRVRELIAAVKQLISIVKPAPSLSASAMGTEEFERPLAEIYMFPQYSSRELFEEITGEKCPPFVPTDPPKYWRDVSAAGLRIVRYDQLAEQENGHPIFDSLGMAVIDLGMPMAGAVAARVNIPPQEWQVTPGKPTPLPIPLELSKLGPDERIMQRSFAANLPVIRDLKKMAGFEEEQAGYSVADRVRDKQTAIDIAAIKEKVGA